MVVTRKICIPMAEQIRFLKLTPKYDKAKRSAAPQPVSQPLCSAPFLLLLLFTSVSLPFGLWISARQAFVVYSVITPL